MAAILRKFLLSNCINKDSSVRRGLLLYICIQMYFLLFVGRGEYMLTRINRCYKVLIVPLTDCCHLVQP